MRVDRSCFPHASPKTPSYTDSLTGGLGSFALFWNPTPMTTTYLIYVAVLIVVVLGISFVLVSRLKKTGKDKESFNFELDPDAIVANILDRAVEMEAKFDLVCTRPSLRQKHIQGFGIVDVSATHSLPSPSPKETDGKEKSCNPYITLRLAPHSIPDGWDKAPIDVYLQLVQNGQGTLYHFATFVCKVVQKGNETLMVINRPSILGDSQSREEVRIEPAPGAVALASAWLYARDSQMLPDKVQGLGKAFGVFRPEGDSDFRIINISACGIRLRFLQDDIDKLHFSLEKHMELCLFMAVNTPQEKSNRLMLWLKAECKGLAPCTDDDCVDVRFSFTHWQQIYERNENIAWNEATLKDRVPPVMHWIMNSAYGMYGDRHIIDKIAQEGAKKAP